MNENNSSITNKKYHQFQSEFKSTITLKGFSNTLETSNPLVKLMCLVLFGFFIFNTYETIFECSIADTVCDYKDFRSFEIRTSFACCSSHYYYYYYYYLIQNKPKIPLNIINIKFLSCRRKPS